MISTRGRYAIRVLIDLAEHRGEAFTPMKEVARRQEISLKYLEKIMPLLSKANMVEGQHGKGGGAAVGRAAADSQHTAVRALVAFRGTRRQSGEHHFIRDDSRHKNTSFFTAAEPGVRDHRTARCTRAAGGACGPRRGRQLFLVNTGGAQSVSLKIWYTGIADFAIIVSQNPLLRRTGPKIFARAAVRDKAGFPLLKNAADAPTHRDSAAAAGSMVFRC